MLSRAVHYSQFPYELLSILKEKYEYDVKYNFHFIAQENKGVCHNVGKYMPNRS